MIEQVFMLYVTGVSPLLAMLPPEILFVIFEQLGFYGMRASSECPRPSTE